ncbi:hypothetical protein Tco_0803715 [Tanacetum coccineum]|uniref:Uncharacterized protein n=1 Tax=Tanacetum coccineum TaxID=301880 RepID=A0ABQ5A6F5_9ASTR
MLQPVLLLSCFSVEGNKMEIRAHSNEKQLLVEPSSFCTLELSRLNRFEGRGSEANRISADGRSSYYELWRDIQQIFIKHARSTRIKGVERTSFVESSIAGPTTYHMGDSTSCEGKGFTLKVEKRHKIDRKRCEKIKKWRYRVRFPIIEVAGLAAIPNLNSMKEELRGCLEEAMFYGTFA